MTKAFSILDILLKKVRTIKTFMTVSEEDKGTGTGSLSNHACYYHSIGTPQSEDKLIFATPDHPVRKFF